MEVLGPYRLLSLIKTGKATQIWEAIRDSTGQRVALKRLQSQHSRQDVALLKNEHAMLSNLEHPNVIQALDFRTHRTGPFLVLELFRVPNMKALIRQGFDHYAGQVDRIVRQAVEAVVYLASCGVVHRDIKPDNFLVSPKGELKLIDFALARRAQPRWLRWLPRRGPIQGTPSYLAPELLRGQGADLPGDVYSLGCTLFELVCGKPPFTAPSTNELLNRHLKQPPPNPLIFRPQLSKQFAQLLQHMLAKEPKHRPAIQDVAQELKHTPILAS